MLDSFPINRTMKELNSIHIKAPAPLNPTTSSPFLKKENQNQPIPIRKPVRTDRADPHAHLVSDRKSRGASESPAAESEQRARTRRRSRGEPPRPRVGFASRAPEPLDAEALTGPAKLNEKAARARAMRPRIFPGRRRTGSCELRAGPLFSVLITRDCASRAFKGRPARLPVCLLAADSAPLAPQTLATRARCFRAAPSPVSDGTGFAGVVVALELTLLYNFGGD